MPRLPILKGNAVINAFGKVGFQVIRPLGFKKWQTFV